MAWRTIDTEFLDGITLRLQKSTDSDEYRVAWHEWGHYSEDKTYYTDDLDDACSTMECMVGTSS